MDAVPATPRDRYFAGVRERCAAGDRAGLARLIWARLADGDGPPVDYFRGDEPLTLLAWVLDKLTRPDVNTFGAALFDVLREQLTHLPDKPTPAAVGMLAAVCELVKLGRKKFDPPKEAVGNVLATLVADTGPTDLARRIHATETPAGQSLLADALRALALHTTPGSVIPPWQKLLADPGLGRAALPAFLGYSRAAGNQARFGLRDVARALAKREQPAPDVLAGALKSFATAAYSDTDYNPNAIDLTGSDFAFLFAGLPMTFVSDTFTCLRKLGFACNRLRAWEEMATATAVEPVPTTTAFATNVPPTVVDGDPNPQHGLLSLASDRGSPNTRVEAGGIFTSRLRGPWRDFLYDQTPTPTRKPVPTEPRDLRFVSGRLMQELNK